MKKINFIIAFLIISLSSKAQQTGSFTDTIVFMSQDRILSCYVPTSYTPSTNYQLMVCLHGMGDNSNNYRNALINSLNWQSVFPNTIFICPDGGDDYASDFSDPTGDEEIIAECIAYAKINYSIDTNNIILQGFSLGGRSALKYGLDNPSKFKGLLLNTPAIQGLDDALNTTPQGVYYNYANAHQIPIYITCGSNDDIYTYTIEKIYEILKKNNSIVKYTIVTGLGHTIPNSTFTSPCLSFFANPATVPYDLDIFEINLAERSCDTLVSPKIYIRNLGSNNVTTFGLNYSLNSINGTYNWTGNIGPYEHTLVSLPQLSATTGTQSLNVSVGSINTSYTDTLTSNNQLSKSFTIETSGHAYPVFEGFESNVDGWIFPKTGSIFEWFVNNNVHKTGLASISAVNTILMFYTKGDIESFLSPVIDLTSVLNPKMSFDLAYNYQKYTPPYFTNDTVFADTLEVSISLDCGETFQTLYKKGGADLATAQSPILNATQIAQCFFTPTANEWRTEVIDLNNYANQSNAIIKFSYISDMGGCISIDNINFANDVSITEEKQEINFNIFPNPAKDDVKIIVNHSGAMQINIYDAMGRKLFTKGINNKINDEILINTSNFNNGVYIVEVISDNTYSNKKLLINR